MWVHLNGEKSEKFENTLKIRKKNLLIFMFSIMGLEF
jgi:hypothetical protein